VQKEVYYWKATGHGWHYGEYDDQDTIAAIKYDESIHVRNKKTPFQYFTARPTKAKRKATAHKCIYRKTKRSNACGGRVVKMRKSKLYKCKECGAKYQMQG